MPTNELDAIAVAMVTTLMLVLFRALTSKSSHFLEANECKSCKLNWQR
jgi:hypothetical protein